MRNYLIIRLALFTAIAVLIGVFSTQLMEYLQYLVGGVMILFGVEGMILPIFKDYKKFLGDMQFYLGHVDMILGIVIITSIPNFNDICIIWGTWTIVREAVDLYEIGHKAMHRFPALFSFALSITEIVLSILLIINAEEHHALTHIYLLVPEFIITALSPLLFEVHKKRHQKKENKQEE